MRTVAQDFSWKKLKVQGSRQERSIAVMSDPILLVEKNVHVPGMKGKPKLTGGTRRN